MFFRLFNAASTISNFTEVGTGEGTYRWGTNGSAGHKIALLGVKGPDIFGIYIAEYVTIPCFATERVNLNQPADMKTQTDPPNAPDDHHRARAGGGHLFWVLAGCKPDEPFLVLLPPFLPSAMGRAVDGTESLNGVITVAPHQCLVAEIRFDDTPIPNGAATSTSDKLAQRNIAWLETNNDGASF